MRKIGILIFLSAIVVTGYAQMAGQLFTGTLKPGSAANSVMIALTPSASFTGQFTNVQFTLQIPDSISPIPSLSIKNNPLSTYIPTIGYLTPMTHEGGFYNYLFASTTASSPMFTFTSGTEINALEVEITCCPGRRSQIRLAQLANGGDSTGQMNFYTEVSGNDNTNITTPFYGAGAVNSDGGYTSYSYVPLANVALPLTLTGFNAIKKDKDALLTWTIANQDANSSRFEIERSFNGIDFSYAGRVEVNLSASLYNFTDANIASTRSAGFIFYRIKTVDKDGKILYSEVRTIKINNKAFEVNLFPNPAKSNTVATINLDEASPITINISDAAGKEIKLIEMPGIKGANVKRIDLSSFASGSYLIKVRSGMQSQTVPLVKQE